MDDRNRPLYMISVAAELAGVHPQTLRAYEQKGLVTPQRTSGNTRMYSQADIERLGLINELTNEGIIYNKRGIGYFIGERAKDIVLENDRKEFLEVELPAFLKKMELLGLDPKELLDKNNWVI